jgi:hypothetical protein
MAFVSLFGKEPMSCVKCGLSKEAHHRFVRAIDVPGWSQQAAEDWREVYQGDPPGFYFKSAKMLVDKYGWEKVRPVLRFYLKETPIEFVRLSKLQSAFGQWVARMGGNGTSRKAQVHEEGLLAFIQGGKRDGRILGSGNGVVDSESPAEGRHEGRNGAQGRYLPPGTGRSDG